jgi:hypothetical protein
MTMISNQMLALRKKKNAQQLTIDKIETLSTTPIKLNGEYFKQRQVKVTIRFSKEKKPRYYLASLLKYPIPQRAVDANKPMQPLESVMVTFAKPESYQETLLPTLLGLNPAFSKENAKLAPNNPSAQKQPANH